MSLLDHRAGGLGQLIRAGRGGNEDGLMNAVFELLESQRPVVQRAGQPEPEFDQVLLARAVAVIHALQLRNGLVAFVDEQQRVGGQIIQQRGRRLTRQAAGEVPRIIFDPVAITDVAHHLQIEHGALPDALRLDALALLLELFFPPVQLIFDAAHGVVAGLIAHDVMRLRIDRQAQVGLLDLAIQRIDLLQIFNFVAPQADAIVRNRHKWEKVQ